MKQEQVVKFYKTPFLFGSIPGKIERDMADMNSQDWRLQFVARVGRNWFGRLVLITIWTRQDDEDGDDPYDSEA